MKSLEPNLKHRNEARGNNTREIRNENKHSTDFCFNSGSVYALRLYGSLLCRTVLQ